MGFAYFSRTSHEKKNQQLDIRPNDMHKEEKRTLQYTHCKETTVHAVFSIFNNTLVILTANCQYYLPPLLKKDIQKANRYLESILQR